MGENNQHRVILHLDADAFFVGCEQAASPELQGKIVAVGGNKKGIIASASYEARQLGIYTPMPTSQALKICPGLIVLPPDFRKYGDYSQRLFGIVRQYTPFVEIGSIDEGYADFSRLVKISPREAGLELKNEISKQLRLSVSIGLATNKLIASTASKLHKPGGFFEVPAGSEAEFLAPLDVKWLPGVGDKTAERMYAAGFHKIGEVATAPLERLGLVVGAGAEQLRSYAQGLDNRKVNPDPEPAQSYGLQESFGENITDHSTIRHTLRRMADALMGKIRSDRRTIRCVEIRLRYADWEQKQCRETMVDATSLETETYSVIDRLLKRAWSKKMGLRLVGLTFSQVREAGELVQGDLGLVDGRQARLTLAHTMDEVKKRFGEASLIRGHQLTIECHGKT